MAMRDRQLERIAELQTSCERSKVFGELQQKSCNKSQCVMAAMETLIVFDFDWSLIDCNSDTWVVDKLGAMERMNAFGNTLPWTELMVTTEIRTMTSMRQFHAQSANSQFHSSCLLQFFFF